MSVTERLTVVLLSLFAARVSANQTLQIMVAHPKLDLCSVEASQCSMLLNEGREDIFSVASRAAADINSHPELLTGYTVEVVGVSSYSPCSVVDLARVLEHSTAAGSTIAGLVGLVGEEFAGSVFPFPSDSGITQVITPAVGLSLDRSRPYPHLYTAAPSMDQLIAAVLELLPALNWTRIGLIYEREESLFAKAAEQLTTFNNCSDRPVTLRQFAYNTHTHKEIQTYQDVNVFVLLLSPENLSRFLCAVHNQGLLWPSYGWIVLDGGGDAVRVKCNSGLSVAEALENVIIVRYSANLPNATVNLANSSADLVADSMWALALALNFSTPLPDSFDGRTMSSIQSYLTTVSPVVHHLERSLINISQVQSGRTQTIGYFNYATRELRIDFESLSPVPTIPPTQTTYNYDIFTPLMTGLLAAVVVLAIIFETVVLGIFIFYRGEPEVKASSVSLSLCIFPGLYLFLFASLNHIINSGMVLSSTFERIFSCCFTTYSVVLGIDIVLATLLMKLLRVWRIFMIYGKTGKLWTDNMMLAFVGVIVMLKVLILIVWTAVDMYTLMDVLKTSQTGSVLVVQQCESISTTLWFAVVFGFSGVLGVCLIITAIKTRKIKHNDFKDTKKICVLVCAFIYMGFVVGTLWSVLRIAGNSAGSKVIIGVAYCVIPVVCLGVILIPKIAPPLRRGFRGRAVTNKQLFGSQLAESLRIDSETKCVKQSI